jgi:ArsR family transcriptional regulator, arsenate/arsenite/antimonite-responsive transcriptional repressor
MKADAIQIFKALGDQNRLRIMKMLEQRELCVCEIRTVLKLSNSTVSEHLAVLRDAGLIHDTKSGKWVNYRLNKCTKDQFIQNTLQFLKLSLASNGVLKSDITKVKMVDRVKICCNTN